MIRPYTTPTNGNQINMCHLGKLLWRMHNEVPMNGEHSALLADVMEAVGMMPTDGMLYTTEVCREIDAMNHANASLEVR